MLPREEIANLVGAINEEALGASIHLQEEEYTKLEAILAAYPEVWPGGLADTLKLLRRKLRWETIDRQAIPESLVGFFHEKFKRDLDPMALAREIGHEICSACEECSCRC
jgi:hypothetical protein